MFGRHRFHELAGIRKPLLFSLVEMVCSPPCSHRWQVGSLVPAASLLLVLEDFLDLCR